MLNGNIVESPVSLEQAQEMLQSFSSVNLDEASPEILDVAFGEFIPDPDGKYSMQIQTKQIYTRVPMHLFNRMMLDQKQGQRMRKKRAQQQEFTVSPDQNEEEAKKQDEQEFEDFIDEEKCTFTLMTDEEFRVILANMDINFVWQLKEILAVWKLTPGEAGMSLKRLYLGLTFEQVEGLFMRFFGARLLKRVSKA